MEGRRFWQTRAFSNQHICRHPFAALSGRYDMHATANHFVSVRRPLGKGGICSFICVLCLRVVHVHNHKLLRHCKACNNQQAFSVIVKESLKSDVQ
jgi:hypothetical protein